MAQLILSSSHGGSSVFQLQKGKTTFIGSDPSCAIHISDPSVAPRHCEVYCRDRVWHVRIVADESTTLLNKTPATEEKDLVEGDTIHVGDLSFIFM